METRLGGGGCAWLVVALGALVWPVAADAAGRQPELVDAAKRADMAAVQALLPTLDDGDIDLPSEDGTTALHWAVHLDNAALVDVLIQAGARVDVANRYDATPLLLACTNGSAAIIERLVKAGVDANRPFATGESPLMLAARGGRPEAVRVLLAHGADVNTRDSQSGQTALMWAAVRGSFDVVEMLLDAGADVHVKTPAVVRENPNDIPFGSDQPPDKAMSNTGFLWYEPDPSAFSALMFAVRSGNQHVLRTLLDGGANVDDKLSNGMTALILAIANKHWELAAYLLDRGADPNDNSVGWTALHHAVYMRRGATRFHTVLPSTGSLSDLDFIRKLLAAGAHVNARMWKHFRDPQRVRYVRMGATPLLVAAKMGDLQVMQLLLDNGANPFMPTVQNITPLMAVAGVALFNPGEEAGAITPEHMAERLEAVKLLVSFGGDVNEAANDGETPLHGAVMLGYKPMVEYLIEQGASLEAKNDRNWTPLTYALGAPYAEFYKEFPDLTPVLERAMTERGLSTEGHEYYLLSDPGGCKHCLLTRADEAQRFVDLQHHYENDETLAASLRAAK